MPQLDMLGWITWGAVIGAGVVLSFVLAWRRVWRTWPAVCTFVWFSEAVQIFLLGLRLFDDATGCQGDTIPAIFFYVYWVGSVIAGLIQLWMIVEIGCAVAPALAGMLRKVIPALALVFLLGVLFLISDAPLSFPLLETRVAVDLDRAVSLAWLTEFVCLSYAAQTVGLRWSRRDLGVGLGFTLQAIAETGISWLRGEFPNHWTLLDSVQNILWLATFAVWTATFLRPDRSTEVRTEPESLLSLANTLARLVKRLRAK